MSPSPVLPNYAYGLRDASGLGFSDVIYTLRPGEGNAPGGEDEIAGVLFGAWSDPDPPEVPLAIGAWSGVLGVRNVKVEAWSG